VEGAPFVLREGVLSLEELPLDRLVAELEGRAAWLLSDAAVRSAVDGLGAPRTVDLGVVGPLEVLSMLARAGHWTRVYSTHELELAERAGFGADHVVAGGRVKDDRLVKDALERGVGAIEVHGAEDEGNVARIAAALGHPVPPGDVSPPDAPPDALDGVGGLLAPVLRGAPDVALDAAWAEGDVTGPADVWPLRPGEVQPGTLTGLSMPGVDAPVLPARVHGALSRSEWAVVPVPRVAAARPPGLTHGAPATVLVREGLWRQLDPRPMAPEA